MPATYREGMASLAEAILVEEPTVDGNCATGIGRDFIRSNDLAITPCFPRASPKKEKDLADSARSFI